MGVLKITSWHKCSKSLLLATASQRRKKWLRMWMSSVALAAVTLRLPSLRSCGMWARQIAKSQSRMPEDQISSCWGMWFAASYGRLPWMTKWHRVAGHLHRTGSSSHTYRKVSTHGRDCHGWTIQWKGANCFPYTEVQTLMCYPGGTHKRYLSLQGWS